MTAQDSAGTTSYKKITTVASAATGLLFLLLLSTASPTRHLQNGLLGLLIGCAIPWLMYVSIWFIVRGFQRTAFPQLSAGFVRWLAKLLQVNFSDYQEKLLIEVAGAMIMIGIVLVLAAIVFCIMSGFLYIAGSFRW